MAAEGRETKKPIISYYRNRAARLWAADWRPALHLSFPDSWLGMRSETAPPSMPVQSENLGIIFPGNVGAPGVALTGDWRGDSRLDGGFENPPSFKERIHV